MGEVDYCGEGIMTELGCRTMALRGAAHGGGGMATTTLATLATGWRRDGDGMAAG